MADVSLIKAMQAFMKLEDSDVKDIEAKVLKWRGFEDLSCYSPVLSIL